MSLKTRSGLRYVFGNQLAMKIIAFIASESKEQRETSFATLKTRFSENSTKEIEKAVNVLMNTILVNRRLGPANEGKYPSMFSTNNWGAGFVESLFYFEANLPANIHEGLREEFVRLFKGE